MKKDTSDTQYLLGRLLFRSGQYSFVLGNILKEYSFVERYWNYSASYHGKSKEISNSAHTHKTLNNF